MEGATVAISLQATRDRMDRMTFKMAQLRDRARQIARAKRRAEKAVYAAAITWAVAAVVNGLAFFGTGAGATGHNLIFGDDPTSLTGLRKRKPGEAPK